jgi:8-oxo-dGTP pyrophosphatase MutT (NUDIX family)
MNISTILKWLNRGLHPVLVIAWNLRLMWCDITGKKLTGAQVLVWYRDKVLVIKNSYRKGYYLPGGGISRNEEPISAAVRELMEETGITVTETQLHPLGPVNYKIQGVPVCDHIFEVKLQDYQAPSVDGREVTGAWFWKCSIARKVPQLQHLRRFMRIKQSFRNHLLNV